MLLASLFYLLQPAYAGTICPTSSAKTKDSNQEYVTFKYSDWDFIHFSISDVQLHGLKDFISETTGDGYDWVGMLLSLR
jgi:hypothetical protein